MYILIFASSILNSEKDPDQSHNDNNNISYVDGDLEPGKLVFGWKKTVPILLSLYSAFRPSPLPPLTYIYAYPITNANDDLPPAIPCAKAFNFVISEMKLGS